MNEKIRLTALVKTRLPDAERTDAQRFCPKCGREIPPERNVCVFCENSGEIPRPKLPRRHRIIILCLIFIFLFLLFLGMALLIHRLGYVPAAVPTELPAPTPGPQGTSISVMLVN